MIQSGAWGEELKIANTDIMQNKSQLPQTDPRDALLHAVVHGIPWGIKPGHFCSGHFGAYNM